MAAVVCSQKGFSSINVSSTPTGCTEVGVPVVAAAAAATLVAAATGKTRKIIFFEIP